MGSDSIDLSISERTTSLLGNFILKIIFVFHTIQACDASIAYSQLLFDMAHQNFIDFRMAWYWLLLPIAPILVDVMPASMPQ
jgi:hypothetical protein